LGNDWRYKSMDLIQLLILQLTDGLKKEMRRIKVLKAYSFFIDQILHIFVICLVVFLFERVFEIKSLIDLKFSTKYLVILAGYIICTKPANILIKEIVKIFKIKINKEASNSDDLPNAGKLIGILERWLVLTFIVISQYEAIGFLIAAKSILRFKEDDIIKTEYIVVGTLLSFAIAIFAGLPIILTGN
jgi:hypothetical protein